MIKVENAIKQALQCIQRALPHFRSLLMHRTMHPTILKQVYKAEVWVTDV
jgi:hypothetical protein